VNYTILVFPTALILLTIYWFASVRKWFTGPKTTVDLGQDYPASSLP